VSGKFHAPAALLP